MNLCPHAASLAAVPEPVKHPTTGFDLARGATASPAHREEVLDGIAAAKSALAGERTGTPKHHHGSTEALRNLRAARRSAVKQRAGTQRQIKT